MNVLLRGCNKEEERGGLEAPHTHTRTVKAIKYVRDKGIANIMTHERRVRGQTLVLLLL